MAPSSSKAPKISDIARFDKFDGSNFKRWKGNMFFYITFLQVAYVLTDVAPEKKKKDVVAQKQSVTTKAEGSAVSETEKEAADDDVRRKKWELDDFMCRGNILNYLSYILYDVYEAMTSTTKELWDALNHKYKVEDAGNKKFLVSKLYDFKIINAKFVLSQVHDLQIIMKNIISDGIKLEESFQVSTIIAKLPSSWKE